MTWPVRLMVMPAAATSHLPELSAVPVLMVSKGVSTIGWVTPSFLATRSIMSTSKPTTLPFCSDWNGG